MDSGAPLTKEVGTWHPNLTGTIKRLEPAMKGEEGTITARQQRSVLTARCALHPPRNNRLRVLSHGPWRPKVVLCEDALHGKTPKEQQQCSVEKHYVDRKLALVGIMWCLSLIFIGAGVKPP